MTTNLIYCDMQFKIITIMIIIFNSDSNSGMH